MLGATVPYLMPLGEEYDLDRAHWVKDVNEPIRLAFEAANTQGMAEAFCRHYSMAWGISPGLDFVMPKGYEQAHASYDPEGNTIHLSPQALAESRVACAYYFLHELRHAHQYLRPQDFPPQLLRGLPYVVMYDGTCHKRVGNAWKSCKLEGPEAYFTQIYLAQPHELDAGNFAYETLKSLADQRQAEELEALHLFWQPAYQLISREDMPGEQMRVYGRIDEEIKD